MKIHESDTVKIVAEFGFISQFRGDTGVVDRIYPDVGVAVVKLDSGEILKVKIDDLIKVTIDPPKPAEPEIPEGAKKILKADVTAFVVSLVDPSKLIFSEGGNGISDLVHMLTVRVVGDKVVEKIFKDQDAVVMTEEELISALWDACSPVSVAEIVDKKMSPRRCREVALAAYMELSEVVSIVFGESEND